MTGDHLDYFCIELPKFEVAEWAKKGWQNLPEKDPLIADALQLAVTMRVSTGATAMKLTFGR